MMHYIGVIVFFVGLFGGAWLVSATPFLYQPYVLLSAIMVVFAGLKMMGDYDD